MFSIYDIVNNRKTNHNRQILSLLPKGQLNMSKFKIGLLLSYICIASMSSAIITPALPQIEQAYSLNHGNIEWVISIFLLGYVIGQLIYAPLANRFGRLKALRIGLVLNLVGILICIVSVWQISYGLLLIGRLVTALGAAAGLSCTFMLINELLSKEQAKRAMSFAIVSFTVGIGIAVTLGGIITQHFHWQGCFILLLFHGLAMLALTWQFPETLKLIVPLHPLNILSGYRLALKDNKLIIYSLTIGLISAIGYCYSAAAPLYAQSTLQLTPESYGYWNLINIVGMMASGFLSAYLMKRYVPKFVLLLGLCCMTPCIFSLIIIAMSQLLNTAWFFVTTMLLYLCGGLVFPAASFFASNALEDKANASSVMSFINMGSAMIAVVAMGYLPMSNISAFATTISAFFIFASVLVLSCMMKDGVQGK